MSILVSDFDGTLTRYDLFDLVRKRWPFSPEDDPWEKFVAGQITHFQALAEIFAHIRTSEADLLKLVDSMDDFSTSEFRLNKGIIVHI
jgi:2-hydroxy-3-keto-5-methylthiopentenyl-1-phosphate phosphatase